MGYTDSDEGRQALRGAYALARHVDTRLRVVTVVRPALEIVLESEPRLVNAQFGKDIQDVEGEYRLLRERELRSTVEKLGDDVSIEAEALVGDPADVLVDLSQRIDLLICGSRGFGPVRGVVLGSVTRRVIAEAHCPVIVIPRGVRATLRRCSNGPGAAAPA